MLIMQTSGVQNLGITTARRGRILRLNSHSIEADDLGFGIELSSNSDGPLSWIIGANGFEGDAESDFDLRVGPVGGGQLTSVNRARFLR